MDRRSICATAEEKRQTLPGDDFIPRPTVSLTQAITLRCTADRVWPWLAQMGAGRAGWYSYDAIDNGGKPSAERIVPQLQAVEVGYVFPWLPHAVEGFVVLAYEEERFLVLGAPAPDGHAIVTWSFVLEPRTDGTTRLIVRGRANAQYGFGRLPAWVVKRLLPPGHFVMQRRQLLGIARRAEQTVETVAAPPSMATRSSQASTPPRAVSEARYHHRW
jgi:hypothetical protein